MHRPHTLSAPQLLEAAPADTLWDRIRTEAEDVINREPVLLELVSHSILNHKTLEEAVVTRISIRLGHATLNAHAITEAFMAALADDPWMARNIRADLLAVAERDPACLRLLEPLLYFKGFHALQTHRLAHQLWITGRTDFALYLQSRASEVFQTDIHPAARLGRGLFLDHATGLVIGSTAVVEDEVSLLQDVTLGGTGKELGDRHPKIRRGVLIGAGAKILGNIEVGHCSRIAAGSVVLKSVPPKTTVAGIPAKIIGVAGCAEPARSMDQLVFGSGI